MFYIVTAYGIEQYCFEHGLDRVQELNATGSSYTLYLDIGAVEALDKGENWSDRAEHLVGQINTVLEAWQKPARLMLGKDEKGYYILFNEAMYPQAHLIGKTARELAEHLEGIATGFTLIVGVFGVLSMAHSGQTVHRVVYSDRLRERAEANAAGKAGLAVRRKVHRSKWPCVPGVASRLAS